MSWRRVLLLSLAFVLALGTTTWFVLQRSDAATVIVQRELSALLLPAASIDDTEIDLSAGRLTVRGLFVEDPTRPGAALLRAEQIDLDVDLTPVGQLLALHRIAVSGLVIDLGPRLPQLAELLRANDRGSGDDNFAIPAIEITSSTLRAALGAQHTPVQITNVTLTAMPTIGAASTLTVDGSGQIDGLDAQLTLSGSIDAESGAVNLVATIPEQQLDDGLLRWLTEHCGADCEGLATAGTLRDLRIELLRVPTENGASQRLQAIGSIRGARVQFEGLPHLLRSADIAFTASTDRGGDLAARIEQSTEQGSLDVTAEITQLLTAPSYALRGIGRDVTVNDDTLDALRLVPIGNAVIDALRPTSGVADIDIYLRNPHLPTGVAEFDMDLREVAMSYLGFASQDAAGSQHRIGFPLPLVGAHGRVRLRDDVVLLEQLGAEIAPAAGGGKVTLSGRIDTTAASGEETTIDIQTEGVAFTPELRTGVSTLLADDGDLYDRLAPSGRADVTVQIRPESVLPGGWAVTVEPRGATVTWSGFPYRLSDLDGTIRADRTSATFDLQGAHGPGRIELRGRIPIATEGPGFEVTMQLFDLVIDRELQQAVTVRAPAIDGHWTDCAPTGSCSGTVRAWRNTEDGPFELDLSIDVAGVDLRLPPRPWRATDLSGQLHITGTGDTAEITFDALRGRLEHGGGAAAQLAMLGTVTCGQSTESDLSLVVRGLDLDGQLGRTLEELDALGTGVWDYLRPSGAVDLVCRHRMLAAGEPELDLAVHLLDVGSDAPILPRPARSMTGELRIRDGELTFTELRADLDGHLVRCLDGGITPGSDGDRRTRIGFTVAAQGFPLDRGFANLFPEPLRTAIADRDLSGAADIETLELTFLVPTGQEALPFETILEGELRLQNVGMRLGSGGDAIRIDALHGALQLEESRIGESGGGLLGSLREASLRMFGQPFETITGHFVADATHMALDRFDARLHGGIVTKGPRDGAAVSYLLPAPATPEGRLAANLSYESVDIQQFLSSAGQSDSPFRGRASGEAVLERLDGQDIVGAAGTGSLRIENGDLGMVPLFSAIYSFLPAPERPRFTDLAVSCRLAERQVAFDGLELESNILGASGSGRLDLDGYLDVKLSLRNLLGNTADPLFTKLIEFLTQPILRFHLFGHLRDLKAEQRWLTESSPRRPPLPPLPPVMSRRPRADY